jgi:uncharacterized protein YkwD
MMQMMHNQRIKKIGQSQPADRAVWLKLVLILLVCLLALSLLGMESGSFSSNSFAAKPTKTPKKGSGSGSGSAYDVIAAVNQVRASNGLSPFEISGALMASAQAHSEYQAATGSISHTGSGGSDPTSRAIAAGYGGGAAVSVIENIYGGMNASPQQAVSWWQTDSLHLSTLLSTRQTDVGAGVATSGGVVYYTLDVGSVTGGSSGSSGSTGASTLAATGVSAVAPATAIAFNPVVIATPNPDGSIVHVVQPGQTLWTIAASYKIALSDLLQLNGFTSNTFIYPGNKILIKPAGAAAAINATAGTSTGTPGAPDSTGKATHHPKTPAGSLPENRTATHVAVTVQPASLTPAGLAAAPRSAQTPPASSGPDPLLLVVAGLVFGGTGLLVVGNLLKRGGS